MPTQTASHVLEHFNRHTILSVLGHWRDLLQLDGKPIIFSTPMVKAKLENRKSQARGVMKPPPDPVNNKKPTKGLF